MNDSTFERRQPVCKVVFLLCIMLAVGCGGKLRSSVDPSSIVPGGKDPDSPAESDSTKESASTQSGADKTSTAGAEDLEFLLVVNTATNANDGYPVHMMVRMIDPDALLTETYDTAVDVLFSDPPDPSILDKSVLFPGTRIRRSVTATQGAPLAAYFFVADPQTLNWKLILDSNRETAHCLQLLSHTALEEDCEHQ